jgi:hypothetical protein
MSTGPLRRSERKKKKRYLDSEEDEFKDVSKRSAASKQPTISNMKRREKFELTKNEIELLNTKEESPITCFCSKPDDQGGFMLGCDYCESWYHGI